MCDSKVLAWEMYVELRKETVERQKIRTQMTGFKIIFISTFFGFLIKAGSQDPILYAIPAMSSICFDLIIIDHSFRIKRIGAYLKQNIEPLMREKYKIPEEVQMWQVNVNESKIPHFRVIGNNGITLLSSLFAINIALQNFTATTSLVIVLMVGILSPLTFILAFRPFKKR